MSFVLLFVIEMVTCAQFPVVHILAALLELWFVVLEEQLASPQRGPQPQLAAAPVMTEVFGSFTILRKHCIFVYYTVSLLISFS